MADVLFIVGEEQFWSHSAILIFSSPVMAAIIEENDFQEGYQSIHIQDVHPHIFRLLLTYLHSGQISDLDASTAESVLAACSRYQIDHLKEICEAALVESMDLNNVVRYLVMSYLNNAINLFEAALELLVENKDRVWNSPPMEDLMANYPELYSLICRLIEEERNQS